jgi:protein gp37
MSSHTHIEWTDATWNPITGCSVVSAGCKHCYAMKLAGTRLAHHPSRAGLTVETKAGPVWNGQVRLNKEWLDQPTRWRKPRRIFVCAHGDLFHDAVPEEWIDKVFLEMRYARHHTFQVLTKRPDRMRAYLSRFKPSPPRDGYITRDGVWSGQRPSGEFLCEPDEWPLPNVWLGVSVEDQPTANERIPLLLQCPAAVRWISAEPLLGPVDLTDLVQAAGAGEHHFDCLRCDVHSEDDEWDGAVIDWVVAGGESGAGARPMHPDWARSLRDQCAAAGVPFLFKQWGAWGQYVNEDHYTHDAHERHAHAWVDGTTGVHGLAWLMDDDGSWSNWTGNPPMASAEAVAPTVAVMGHFGKKAAGRLLDGVLHDAYPEASA